MARRYQYRTCAKCAVTKHFLEFDKYRTKNQRKPACIACTRAKVAGNGPHQSLAPCLGCGKSFMIDGPHSRAVQRKTCSKECAYASMRKAARPCQHCHRILSFDQFARKNTARTRKLTCLECERDLLARKTHPSDHMPHIFLSLAQSIAHRRSFDQSDAYGLCVKGCVDCGIMPTHFALKDRDKHWTTDNVDALCEVCTMAREAMGPCLVGNATQVIQFLERHFPRNDSCSEQKAGDLCPA